MAAGIIDRARKHHRIVVAPAPIRGHVLGCEPDAFPCFNDPSLTTNDVVGKNLTAEGALAVLSHHNAIGRNVVLSGGGGGVTSTMDSPLPNAMMLVSGCASVNGSSGCSG